MGDGRPVAAHTGSAPGRLDLLGGVADYAGALVLEVPTRVTTTVTATPDDRLRVGDVEFTPGAVAELAGLPYGEIRARLADVPRWTRYLIGVALVLVRHGVIGPPAVRLTVASDVPSSLGVSSSAALEVATARALGADRSVDPLRLAVLCQEAENEVVGAPCGVMDQVAVTVGTPGDVLPILCRPASVEAGVPLPEGTEVVGWPSGAAHDVADGAYARARAASFMGRRMVEEATGQPVGWTSDLPDGSVATLPDELGGAEFLDRFGGTDDHLTVVAPDVTYPVRAAASFGVDEHARSHVALRLLRSGDAAGLAPLLAASHRAYSAMGLGHPATDRIVAEALARPGVLAARVGGGGCGGTVVTVCRTGALDDVPGIIR